VTRVLLDTRFLVDAERQDEAWGSIADDDEVAVAAVTVAELRVGALLADGRHRAARTAFVEEVVASVPVLVYDLDVAEAHAELLVQVRRQGSPRGAHDMIIAATARASGRTVVSADATAFQQLDGVAVRAYR
jgi:predicted nucleic acid-binding protein